MNYSQAELNAVLEGFAMKSIDLNETLAVLAANIRIANNKKRLKVTDLFNRRKAEARVQRAFSGNRSQEMDSSLADRIKKANEYFMYKDRK